MTTMTGKQERNGVSGGPTHNSAIPGPDATATISAALNASTRDPHYQAVAFDGIAAGDTVVDWETGVYGHSEQPGEA